MDYIYYSPSVYSLLCGDRHKENTDFVGGSRRAGIYGYALIPVFNYAAGARSPL